MKILGLILMMAFFNISSGDNSEAYLSQVSDKYQAYNVVYQAYDEDYEICIINGVMNGYQSYGVYFYSNTKNYKLVAQSEDEIYAFPTVNGEMVWCLAIDYDNPVTISVLDKKHDILYTKATLVEENFNNIITPGSGNGVEFSQLNCISRKYNNQIIFYVVLAVIISVCLTTILILRITHSGIFSKANRSAHSFNMKEFLENTDDETDPYDPLSNITLIENVEEEKIETENKMDVKKYLLDKGYIIDYKSLSEDEKNKIMVELMVLKNEGKISEEDYKKETIELWKK